jgi:7-cyano-7-deazaguanine synthase
LPVLGAGPLRRAGHVAAVTFDYGQRHRIELDCAAQVAARAGTPHIVLPIDTFAVLGGNALTDPAITVAAGLDSGAQLPNTFVPGRNLIFLTFAAALAYQRGIRDLVTGVAQTDYSGYPDCRQATLQALEQTLRLGMDCDMTLHTPLMFKSKAETVRLARDLGALAALGRHAHLLSRPATPLRPMSGLLATRQRLCRSGHC